MSEIDWQAGDVAWIECEHPSVHLLPSYGVWVNANCSHFPRAYPIQPVLILRPDDEEGVKALADAIRLDWSGNSASPEAVLPRVIKHLIAAQHAPKMPEEPTDLAARVTDTSTEETFAKIGDLWVGGEGTIYDSWSELVEHCRDTLEILAPDGATDE